MDTTDILKRVRQIEIKTRGLSNNIFAGEYHSAFKGRGMMFSEVREYNYGDDIRNIDWNVTARFHHPYIKVFEEEREMTVMLLIDVSGSREFGTTWNFKKNIITEMAAVLAFSAIQNNDKAGVIFFSDRIEKFIPPKKGRKHILHIIRELISFVPDNRETNISEVLRYLTGAIKKKCTTFLISDFLDDNFEQALKIANQKHDMVALRVYDPREQELPDVGFIQFKDAETGETKWVNTSRKKNRDSYNKWWRNNEMLINNIFTKCGVDNVAVRTDDDYVKALMSLFKKRN
ncbi:DUF58 domain-containing protein [Geofilum sp. OHC36d9]|uniref:DUF58 domain-containing protein n=1 Tax=Geofilum sp. OHC36d9 TaxID=3458413 RepID=UPI0040339D98